MYTHHHVATELIINYSCQILAGANWFVLLQFNELQVTGAGGRKWTKRVHKEWNILENNLPGTILIREAIKLLDLINI